MSYGRSTPRLLVWSAWLLASQPDCIYFQGDAKCCALLRVHDVGCAAKGDRIDWFVTYRATIYHRCGQIPSKPFCPRNYEIALWAMSVYYDWKPDEMERKSNWLIFYHLYFAEVKWFWNDFLYMRIIGKIKFLAFEATYSSHNCTGKVRHLIEDVC